MNTIPVPMFWEALTMGAQTPLCRGTFIGDNGAGCLVTAAVRACGVTVETSEQVILAALRLWPWLESGVCPAQSAERIEVDDSFETSDTWKRLRACLPAVWLITHYDKGHQDDWIIAQIRDLEEYVSRDKQAYLDRVNAEVTTCA